jgi:predicted ATPase
MGNARGAMTDRRAATIRTSEDDRWNGITALFAQVLAAGTAARPRLLDGADAEVRREVEALLAAHEATGPLDRLALQVDDLCGALWGSRDRLSGASTRVGSGGQPDQPGRLLQAGYRLGRHEIRGHLGAGGMGEVYRAYDTRLQREVAIKVLRQRVQRGPGALARLEQEARAASALNHPNIVTVHDLGEEDSFPYIVMELVEGESLRQRIEGPLPAGPLLRWAVQIGDGLVAAHERQVVHGDIKPENILLSSHGIAKILDFGLAHVLMPDASHGPPGSDDVTAAPGESAALLGTPGYLAPELIAGLPLDQRSDQFSFAAMLYEMATGTPAFPGRGMLEVLRRTVYEEPPSLRQSRPDLPAAFVQAVERGLHKQPDARHASTRALLDQLRAAARDLIGPGEPGLPRRACALPAQRTRLIGRARELQGIEQLVANADVRLLTLIGPGGTGKTRLALKAAELLAPKFHGGVFFVGLAAITDPALVAPAIARTIGATVLPGQASLAAVIDELRTIAAPALLLLDNFEQIIAAGVVIGELLAACPNLTVMVTSREVLHVYGEQIFPVVALELPDPARAIALPQLAAYPAVALFVERAQAVNPSFSLTVDNAAAVATLCARLEGLPLALELAAAQARALSPQSMLARMGQRLELLTGGARDLPARQQTLRRTLDWSHQLLSPAEQAVLRRVAVFAGGFTLEAAQAVADPFGKLDPPVSQIISALADKSLLQPLQLSGAADEELRFVSLETVREYARETLASSGEDEHANEAHAAYFLVLAEEGSAALTSAEQPHLLERFATEYDNFRAALDWSIRRGRAEWGVRLALGLFSFWERGEHLAEGRRRLGELIELEGTAALPALRARALFAAGVLANHQGDIPGGIDLHNRCLAQYRALGDGAGTAVALVALGNQHVAAGDNEQARRLLQESLELWQQQGDDTSYARSLSNLAFATRAQGAFADARSLYRRAAAMFERLDDRLSHAWTINLEGDVAQEQNDLPGATALYEGALDRFRRLGHGWGVASALADLGTVARQRGDHRAAGLRYRESLASYVRLNHRRGIARLLECLALLAVDQDDPERGLTLAAHAAALRARVGGTTSAVVRLELEGRLSTLHDRIGAETAQALWQRGADLSLGEVVRLATADC